MLTEVDSDLISLCCCLLFFVLTIFILWRCAWAQDLLIVVQIINFAFKWL